MLQIAICDDDRNFIDDFRRQILKAADYMKYPVKIDVFFDGKALLKQLCYVHYPLVFLDIELGNRYTGIQIARAIRRGRSSQSIELVFVSSHQHYSFDLHAFQPLHFLIKPIHEPDIINVLKLFRSRHERNDFFTYKTRNENLRIPFDDIIYFEIEKDKREHCMIHTRNRTFSIHIKEPFKDFVKLFPKQDFFEASYSCYVNYFWVQDAIGDMIILNDQTTIYMSRRCKQDFYSNYFNA